MRTLSADELRAFVGGIFQKRGLSERNAGVMANCLVHANLRGTDSHGVMRVPHYVQRLEMGSVNPTPDMKFTRTAAATGTLDGDHGFGHIANWDAMGHAIDIAKESGIGLVGVNHSNHCGALSFFAYRALEAGMIGFVFTQTDKGVVPFGGKVPFCGTNPLCFGIPSASGVPVVLDMATSTVAGGHIYKARVENKPIPPTWALDAESKPTTDPHKAVFWTPAAGAKGYGLGVIIDILTGVMSGGAYGPNIPIMYGDLEKKRNLCHLVGAVDFRRFAGAETFLPQVAAMAADLHAQPAADLNGRVLAPGEPEHLRSLERAASGIPVDDAVWDELAKL
jgi:ureidoglycolate dehydrogenase (NAD+)